jgi:hypothetical protein
MATQSEINASLGLPPGINPDGSWNAQDYMARRVAGQVDTQAQVDAARASAQAELMRAPGQSVTDASGREVQLTSYRPGFDPNNVTTQTYLGELEARGGMDTTSQLFKQTATPAQLAANASAYAIELARLQEIDRQAALAAQGQNVATKNYTDAEVKQALKDLSYLDPNASINDIIGAAQTYGIDRDRVVKNISSFTYNAENVDKLSKQILAQNTTNAWKGDVKPETAARYMADDLAKSGITDISQVGKGDTGIINTVTGEKLISGYGERTKGNLWSGSYEGKGNTGFGVQFTETGKPIFYTEGASSSTLKKDLLKAAVIAGAAFGIVGPEAFSGIFGSGAAASTALGAEAAATGLTLAELGGTAGAVGGTTGLLSGGVGATALGTGLTAGSSLSGLTAGSSLSGLTAGAGALTGANTLLGGAALGTTLGSLGAGVGGSLLGTAATGLGAGNIANLLSGGLGTAGNLLQMQQSREAAQKAQAMIDAETAAAKTAAQFRPIGMTTRFGTSQFTVDPVTGQLTSAGYTASPGVLEAQNRLVALGNQGLAQAEQAQAQFAPLQAGAERLFELGQGYLAKTPEQVASDYLKSQMALLQPSREVELANLQTRLRNQGRIGLSVAQGGDLADTTPELQALYNARAQQEAQLAANAQQYGQQNVLFGAGLLGQGSQAMGQYYGGQQASYAPYTTALGQFTNLEQLAQQPLQMGATLGQQSATAGANVGQLGLRGAGQSVALATGADATRSLGAQSLIAAGNPNAMFGQALGNVFGGLFS